MIWRREPVLFQMLAFNALGAAVAFGLDLTNVQLWAVMGVVNAVLSLIVRQVVTPYQPG